MTNDKTVDLTEVERTLQRLLLDVADYIDNTEVPESVQSTVPLPEELVKAKLELRFTGGWVRDKLLGVTSHDIDVAINKMTGYQFGLKMKEYLEMPGNAEKYGLEGVAQTEAQSKDAVEVDKNKKVGGLHKIEANPEKSKHLETVTTRILGLDIDLVNLRKETYTEVSRNPEMEFGTPEEDALRRDATVNAMFYNLNTGKIEDFTGQGFTDMRLKVIRTPLEPHQTFKDDPLRVLRLIRFASRLNYSIDPAAEESMSREDIKEALRIKISRERVGIELEKMLKGPDPCTALRMIDRMDLYKTIFTDPTKDYGYTPDLDNWRVVYEHLGTTQTAPEFDYLQSMLYRDADEKYLAWIMAALVPYADAPALPPPKPNSKVPPPIASAVAREGFKAPSKVCDVITAAVRNSEDVTSVKDKVIRYHARLKPPSNTEDPTARDTLGMAIRRWGQSWRSQVVFSMLAEIAHNPALTKDITADYQRFLEMLATKDVLEAYSFRPLLDGTTLAKALTTKPGPWMKDALDVVMAWQLRHPDKTDPEEAIREVRDWKVKHGELAANLISHFLQLTIRPLFAKTQNPDSVTEQGRRVTTTVLPRKTNFHQPDEAVTKPWKQKEAWVLDLLKWVVERMDEGLVEKNWHLLVPPLLKLLDDSSTDMKVLGCQCWDLLLQKTPPQLLRRTGLGEVIEEAVAPLLSYLPTLTPVDESAQLLNATYPTLLTLARVRWAPEPPLSISENARKRMMYLDSLLRNGIISGLFHAGEHVRVAETLVNQLPPILNELGIESVKHLKDLIPVLSKVLTDPFAPAYPPLLVATGKAFQSIELNAWPRIDFWKYDILQALTVCWVRLNQEDKQFPEVEAELRTCVAILGSAIENLFDELKPLIDADERLKHLLRA